MENLYEYIKAQLYYHGYLNHPTIARLIYAIDDLIVQNREQEAKIEELRKDNKALKADAVKAINLRLERMEINAQAVFMSDTQGIPRVLKVLIKPVFTTAVFCKKVPFLWQRFRYSI